MSDPFIPIQEWSHPDLTVYLIPVPTPFPVGPVNIFLVKSASFLVLVDAGMPSDAAWDALVQALGACDARVQDIAAVILTHHHLDHTGLLERLVTTGSPTVYAHPDAHERLCPSARFIEEQVAFFTHLYQKAGAGNRAVSAAHSVRSRLLQRPSLEGARLCAVQEGDSIPELPGMQVIHTPGHAPDHIVLYHPDCQLLLGGDLVLPSVSSNALVERGKDGTKTPSVTLYRRSLERCAALSVRVLGPGHGSWVTDCLSLIRYRLRRIDEKAQALYQLIRERPMTPMEVAERLYPAQLQSPLEFPLVMSEVIGMLDYLLEQGQISVSESRDAEWVCTAGNT